MNRVKRVSLLVVCVVLMVGITIGAFSAWFRDSGDSREFGLRLGMINQHSFIISDMIVNNGNDNFNLFPFDQPRMPRSGVRAVKVEVNMRVQADTLFDAEWILTMTLNGDQLEEDSFFYIFIGDTMPTLFVPDDEEATNDNLMDAVTEGILLPLATTGSEIVLDYGVIPMGAVGQETFTFFIILVSDNNADMGKSYDFQVVLENAAEHTLADIAYSSRTWSTQEVTAQIRFNNPAVNILNNNGSYEYTFTRNGSFTWQWEDTDGSVRNTTATVSWIRQPQPEVFDPTVTHATGSFVMFGQSAYIRTGPPTTAAPNGLGNDGWTFVPNYNSVIGVAEWDGNLSWQWGGELIGRIVEYEGVIYLRNGSGVSANTPPNAGEPGWTRVLRWDEATQVTDWFAFGHQRTQIFRFGTSYYSLFDNAWPTLGNPVATPGHYRIIEPFNATHTYIRDDEEPWRIRAAAGATWRLHATTGSAATGDLRFWRVNNAVVNMALGTTRTGAQLGEPSALNNNWQEVTFQCQTPIVITNDPVTGRQIVWDRRIAGSTTPTSAMPGTPEGDLVWVERVSASTSAPFVWTNDGGSFVLWRKIPAGATDAVPGTNPAVWEEVSRAE